MKTVIVIVDHTEISLRAKLERAGQPIPEKKASRGFIALTPRDAANGPLPVEKKARVGQGQIANEPNARADQMERIFGMMDMGPV